MAATRKHSWTIQRLLVSILCALAIAVPVLANTQHVAAEAEHGWTQKAEMPTIRHALAVVAYPNGKIYAMGGTKPPGFSGAYGVVEEYNPDTDSWITPDDPAYPAAMLTPRVNFAATVADNLIYAIGGNDGITGQVATVEAYDPVANSWVSKTSMQMRREQLGVAASGGKVYAIGGVTNGRLNVVEQYDPATDKWEYRTPMPTARCGLGVVTGSDGRIYAIGGSIAGAPGAPPVPVATVEIYDPVTDTWTTGCDMPAPREYLSVALLPDGKIIAMGGGNLDYPTNAVEIYDPLTHSWTAAEPMPTARYAFGAATATNGKVYAIGGTNGMIWPYDLGVNEEYSVPSVSKPVDMFLRGADTNLRLDTIAPTSTTARYKDSPGINRTTFREIGIWNSAPMEVAQNLTNLGNLTVWVGLKNSDDQGTYFDVRAEVLKNGVVIASGEVKNIKGVTRNPDLAKKVDITFGTIPETFFSMGDIFSVRVSAKVADTGGHSNAVGLRLYYDSVSRPSVVNTTFRG